MRLFIVYVRVYLQYIYSVISWIFMRLFIVYFRVYLEYIYSVYVVDIYEFIYNIFIASMSWIFMRLFVVC